MKKLLFAMAFLLMGVSLNAQNYTLTSIYGGTSDSVTNAETTVLSKQITGTGVVTVQLNITKLSGTAAGTAILQGSLDGTNYVTLHYATGGATTGVQNDSFTLTNVTSQSVTWVVNPSAYSYYRVSVTGSGTTLMTLRATAVKR